MTTIPICILTPAGVIDASYVASSLADAATKEPEGVYTVARTYHRHFALLINEHLDRLEQSAQLEHIAVKLDRDKLRQALRDLIEKSGYEESRFRLTIPRKTPDQVIISLEPHHPVPPEIIEHGARVITTHAARQNPSAKTTRWMAERRSTVEGLPPGIYEAILVSDGGNLLEGTSSNFYGILDGTLHTADEGVLKGIGRNALLRIAPEILPVALTPVHIEQIGKLSEALITSSGRGVVPVVEIDGHSLGIPGPLTRRLREAYNAWAEAHLEMI